MDYREIALTEISDRIKRDADILELKAFKRNSNDPINKVKVPAIYMFEGRDVIEKYKQGNALGYPARRHLEINIEVVIKSVRGDEGKAVKDLLQLVKRSVFCDRTGDVGNYVFTPNVVVAKNSFIKELRVKGPGTYEVPELIGIKLVVGLWYVDNGFL